jgi:AraC-like DNA-binding protein
VHAHRAHGRLDLHLVGLPADDNPLGLHHPAVLAVSPLLRELILAYTRDPGDDSPERRRLRAVLCDQLRLSPQQPLRLPTAADPRLAAVCALVHADPAGAGTLDALGAATGVGERTLSRLFRSEFGMTFPQWRTQSRLYHALRMLADRHDRRPPLRLVLRQRLHRRLPPLVRLHAGHAQPPRLTCRNPRRGHLFTVQ